MNTNAIINGDNNCTVIEENGRVRKVHRINSSCDFVELFKKENYIEELENKKKSLEKENNSSKIKEYIDIWKKTLYAIVGYFFISLIVFVLMWNGILIKDYLIMMAIGIVLGVSLGSIASGLVCLDNKLKKKRNVKRINELDNEIKELTKKLDEIKTNDVVMAIEINEPAIKEETISKINDAISDDIGAKRFFEKFYVMALREITDEYNNGMVKKKKL